MSKRVWIFLVFIVVLILAACDSAQPATDQSSTGPTYSENRLLVGTGDGLYASETEGNTFFEVAMPAGSDADNVEAIDFYADGRVGIATRDGLHVYTQDLTSFESYGSGLSEWFKDSVLLSGHFYVATDAGLYVFEDGSPSATPDVRDTSDGLGATAISHLVIYDDTVVIGHANGLSLTKDGKTFTNVTSFPGTTETRVNFLKIIDTRLLIGVNAAGVYDVSDLSKIGSAPHYLNIPSTWTIFDLDPWNSSEVLAIPSSYGVYAYDGTTSRRFDTGATGFPTNAPPPPPPAPDENRGFSFIEVAFGKVFAVARSYDSGFYVSADGGATYTPLDSAVCGTSLCWVSDVAEQEL